MEKISCGKKKFQVTQKRIQVDIVPVMQYWYTKYYPTGML
jgi:hypothetical protein